MAILLASLTVAGAGIATWGAIDMYRGRMREDPPDSGLYTLPTTSPKSLVLTLVGVVIALAGGLLPLFF